MKKVLITGGAGYLGSVISELLLTENYKVTVLDNLIYNQLSILHLFKHENFEFIKGDVRDTQLLKPLVEKADIIIPLAAIVGMPACKNNPQLATEINYTQIENIIKFSNPSQKIILPNTNSQYGSSSEILTEDSKTNPLSHYAVTKCDAETLLIENGNGISLRLATVFGISPRMRLDLLVNDFVYKSLTDGYLVLFESHFKRNYIHVQDIARVFKFMIENYEKCNNNVFNVGLSDANLSKEELAEKIKTYVPELIIVKNNYKQDLDKRNYIISSEKLKSFGWEPIFSLDYGIKQLLNGLKIINNTQNKNFTNL